MWLILLILSFRSCHSAFCDNLITPGGLNCVFTFAADWGNLFIYTHKHKFPMVEYICNFLDQIFHSCSCITLSPQIYVVHQVVHTLFPLVSMVLPILPGVPTLLFVTSICQTQIGAICGKYTLVSITFVIDLTKSDWNW